jgi:hypothetical protein
MFSNESTFRFVNSRRVKVRRPKIVSWNKHRYTIPTVKQRNGVGLFLAAAREGEAFTSYK